MTDTPTLCVECFPRGDLFEAFCSSILPCQQCGRMPNEVRCLSFVSDPRDKPQDKAEE